MLRPRCCSTSGSSTSRCWYLLCCTPTCSSTHWPSSSRMFELLCGSTPCCSQSRCRWAECCPRTCCTTHSSSTRGCPRRGAHFQRLQLGQPAQGVRQRAGGRAASKVQLLQAAEIADTGRQRLQVRAFLRVQRPQQGQPAQGVRQGAEGRTALEEPQLLQAAEPPDAGRQRLQARALPYLQAFNWDSPPRVSGGPPKAEQPSRISSCRLPSSPTLGGNASRIEHSPGTAPSARPARPRCPAAPGGPSSPRGSAPAGCRASRPWAAAPPGLSIPSLSASSRGTPAQSLRQRAEGRAATTP